MITPVHAAGVERLFRWLAWACVGLVAVLSLTPGDYIVRTTVSTLLEHFVAYLGTSAVVSIGYRRRLNPLNTAALLSSYAALLEIGQHWVPGRHSQLIDFAASATGVVAGVVVMRLWRAR